MIETTPIVRKLCSTSISIVIFFVLLTVGASLSLSSFFALAGGLATIMALEGSVF